MSGGYSSYGYGYGYGSPMAGGEGAVSNGSGGTYNPRYHFAAAQEAGFDMGSDETQPRTLYVGNLDHSVTEDFIGTLFGQFGIVTKTKVVHDGQNDPYAFVEYAEHNSAQQALLAMNKRQLLDKEMKVNWAAQPGAQQSKVDTSKHFHVFVGDLSPEVDNKTLKEAFAPFGTVSDAKVIRDLQTLKSKGYGFVSYVKKEEAERAIESMNGQWLGRRTIRTSWATRQPSGGSGGAGGGGDMRFDEVMAQTTPTNSTVYVGGIGANVAEEEIHSSFGHFGTILDIRLFRAQGYAFVRFDKKESAAHAICNMNGGDVGGTSVRCSWGRANPPGMTSGYGTGHHHGGGAAGGFDHNEYGSPHGGGYGGGASAAAASAAAQQQYWNYYQQYYNNPQVMQQWQQYYQQQQQQGGQGGQQ